MFHVRYPVSPYIARVSRCNQCFRFGHIKVNCKSQPRCAHCEGKGHTFSKEQCQHSEDPPKCANCKGDHRVDSPSCPELITQKEIRKYAAFRNVFLLDAINIFKGNKSSPLCSLSSEEYPNLPFTRNSTNPLQSNPFPHFPPSTFTSSSTSFANAARTSSVISNPYPKLTQDTKLKSVSLPQLKRSFSAQHTSSP